MIDMSPQEPSTTGRRKTSPSSPSTARNLVRSVTADNWQAVAGAFIGAYGGVVLGLEAGECQGVAFGQSPRQWGAWRAYFKKRGIKTTFMDAKAKATAESKATVNPHCWTVPAEWPHMFDADATVQEDHEAGNLFMRNWRPPNLVMADAAQRAITAAAARRWNETTNSKPQSFRPFPKLWEAFKDEERILQGHRFEVYEEASRKLAMHGKEEARKVMTGGFYKNKETLAELPKEEKGQFIDRDQLLKDYDKDMAELRARSNKFQEAAE